MTLEQWRSFARPVVVAALLSWTVAALAGGSMGDDDHDDSRNVIGSVRDLGSGPMADARVVVLLKGSASNFVTRTDTLGRYRLTGLAADVDPKVVEVTCSKDGYKYLRSVVRNPSPLPEAAIEVDCLMEK